MLVLQLVMLLLLVLLQQVLGRQLQLVRQRVWQLVLVRQLVMLVVALPFQIYWMQLWMLLCRSKQLVRITSHQHINIATVVLYMQAESCCALARQQLPLVHNHPGMSCHGLI